MNDQEVAGLRCRTVLAQLSDYMGGGMSAAERSQLEAHVVGCRRCEQFGGVFGRVVRQLRLHLDEPVPTEVEARLRARLEQG